MKDHYYWSNDLFSIRDASNRIRMHIKKSVDFLIQLNPYWAPCNENERLKQKLSECVENYFMCELHDTIFKHLRTMCENEEHNYQKIIATIHNKKLISRELFEIKEEFYCIDKLRIISHYLQDINCYRTVRTKLSVWSSSHHWICR